MLDMSNWYIENDANTMVLSQILSDINAYPQSQVDRFFAALRIITALKTGYAQLRMQPNGWASHHKVYPSFSRRNFDPR